MTIYQNYKIKTLLKDNTVIKLLNNNEFQNIYNILENMDDEVNAMDKLLIPVFTELLFKSNIDPLPYLTTLPPYFAFNLDIESITIPSNIEYIDEGAFWKSKIKNIKLPNTLKSIYQNTFRDCQNLEKITIPKSVEVMGNNIFFYCLNLKEVTFEGTFDPSMSDNLELDIFDRCHKLKDIYYGGDMTSWANLNCYANNDTIVHCTDGNYKYDIENDSWYEVT